MKAKVTIAGIALCCLISSCPTIQAQEAVTTANNDSVTVKKKPRLTIGGYGEAVTHRYFYSNDFNRYSYPEKYSKAPSRGEFDVPHVVFYIGYDFGRGWSIGSEIEYEHGGTGSAVEIEEEEFGEYESEVEKGGEVNLSD